MPGLDEIPDLQLTALVATNKPGATSAILTLSVAPVGLWDLCMTFHWGSEPHRLPGKTPPDLTRMNQHLSFIWSVADLLRGDYKQSEYGKVILPFTVLRRLDCVLAPPRPPCWPSRPAREGRAEPRALPARKAGQLFYNTSPLDLKKLMGDQDHIGENLAPTSRAFSPAVRDIFERFEFHTQIERLAKAGLLYLVTEKFANIDLHPDVVSNARWARCSRS
jgi:hypothetical protein